MRFNHLTILLLFLLLLSCTSQEKLTGVEAEPFYTIDESLDKDEEIEAKLASWREIYGEEMDRRVVEALGNFHFGKPESSLGNLTADMLRYRASHEMERFVHLALINRDGFGIEFREGPITLDHLYQFMPYDNTLVVLEMPGSKIAKLADEIASRGGVPVSGLRMMINNGRATGILVNSEHLDPERTYYLATSSYVAGGGGGFDSLLEHNTRHDFDLLIRDLFIDHLRRYREVAPEVDLRIREM